MIVRTRTLLTACACLALAGGSAAAQTVVPVTITGDSANRVDVVFLGDGYTSAEMTKFAADVDRLSAAFLAEPPFSEYPSYFNVRRIEMASAETGASHPNKGITRDTVFGAYYNCGGTERLICVNTGKVLSVVQGALASNEHDLIIVLVNDPEYGGSGGAVTVASLNAAATELVLHEGAHTFGLLADEYEYGATGSSCDSTLEPASVNATREIDRDKIKWREWIDATTPIPTTTSVNGLPGLFLGAMYCQTGVYRPIYNSKMRSLGQGFWQVSSEQLVRRLYAYVDPIDSVSPAPGPAVALASGEPRSFSVMTPTPATHALSAVWWLDGQQLHSGASCTVSTDKLAAGSHRLELVVTDPTDLVRSDPFGMLTSQANWTLNVNGVTDDFSLTTDRAALVAAAGQSALLGLTLTPMAATFQQPVSLSCSGLPLLSECTFSPATIAQGSGASSSIMTIRTTAAHPAAVAAGRPRPLLLACVAFPGLVLLLGRRRRFRAVALTAGVLAVTVAFAACGGADVPKPPDKKTQDPGTPAGTYAISVTATSGTLSRTATVQLTVTP